MSKPSKAKGFTIDPKRLHSLMANLFNTNVLNPNGTSSPLFPNVQMKRDENGTWHYEITQIHPLFKRMMKDGQKQAQDP